VADPFAPDLVEPLLPPDHPFRGRIRIVAQATSTQDLARQSAEPPSVWAAEIQTAGRGRQGHPWISDHPGGLWCSVLWEPREKSFSLLSILGALAAADAVRVLTGLTTALKWPNDLLWKNKKLAGLLVETVARPGRPPLAILGLGLNVSQLASDFPPGLKKIAVSLRQASGRVIPRAQMLAAFLDSLTCRLSQAPAEAIEDFRAAWGQQGRLLQMRSGGQEFVGVAEQVDDSGHLHLRLGNQSVKVFASGEVDFPA
jgi:BirA family biotin operon repressor/biotin-[acetyl-CoA-carboxylase] ligase